MSTPTFSILLGGNITVTDRLRAVTKGSRVIAADSGIRHASALGLTPKYGLGISIPVTMR